MHAHSHTAAPIAPLPPSLTTCFCSPLFILQGIKMMFKGTRPSGGFLLHSE